MAAKLGAKQVFLYETAEVASVAAKVVNSNRAKACQVFACHSSEFDNPPKVDVVVSETLGNYAFEENIIDTLHDARRRHLKPGGIIIPSRVTQYVSPVVGPRIDRELRAWERVGHGLDFSAAQAMSFNNVYVRSLQPGELLRSGAAAKAWDEVDFSTDSRSNRKGEIAWKLAEPQTIYGFAYWWVAQLVPKITLSTAPDAPSTHWEQLYFPLMEPIVAKKGETVSLSLRSKSSEQGGTHLGWTGVHLSTGGSLLRRHAHDLDKGYLP
jgi:protein arginine N-methyltransferase 1